MKYLFIYYTGTYNTRFLTEKIKERLLCDGDSFDTVEITKNTPVIDTDGYDVIGLGYPIYGFNSPLPFNRYIRKLRFREGQPYFIYKNSGETMELNNASSRIPLKIMEENGCTFLGEYHFLMPYNIHFPFSEDLICAMLAEDKKLLDVMAYNLEHGIVHTIESNPLLDLTAFAVSVQKLGGNVNSYFYHADSDKCIRCGKCVRECPENNITWENGQITFGHNCDMCMRCSFYCPAEAISIGMLESWRVSSYYNLDDLWQKEPMPYTVPEDIPFAKYYQKTFAEIDEAYEAVMTGTVETVFSDDAEPAVNYT